MASLWRLLAASRSLLGPGLGLGAEARVSARAGLRRSSTSGAEVQVGVASCGTLVCLHPARETDYSGTRELRQRRARPPPDRGVTLTAEQAAAAVRLRSEDGELWSVAALARLFNVKKGIISKLAPATPARRAQLVAQRRMMAALRPHKRKLLRAKQLSERHRRLEQALKEQQA